MQAMRDPKAMAKTLKSVLADDHIQKSHSECLEIVAKQLGFSDWNTASAVLSGDQQAQPKLVLPQGWKIGGSEAQDYRIGIDPSVSGSPATIQSLHTRGEQTGFATLMQSVDAAQFVGQRVRLKADLKSEDCVGAATLWMRLDRADGRQLILDNMEMRQTDGVLTGTQDWTSRQIVLEVSNEAARLNYGFYLRGTGKCWSRRFDISTVTDAVPVTERKAMLEEPTNLSFAEKAG